MRVEVFDNVFVGDMEVCSRHEFKPNTAYVHGCKHPCHLEAVGYTGSLPPSHLYWLHYSRSDMMIDSHELFLNLVDPPSPSLFKKKSFDVFLEYMMGVHVHGKEVNIHCNEGKSRGPSLALLYGAKILGELPNSSYEDAAMAFKKLYRDYEPAHGISKWLTANWKQLWS